MKLIMIAEHFELTPSIRSHVEDQIAKIESHLAEDAVVRVFLRIFAKGEFGAVFKARARGREVVATVRGPDLYSAAAHAATTLRKELQKAKNRRISSRRNQHEHANELESQPA